MSIPKKRKQMKAYYVDQINEKGYRSEITDLRLSSLGEFTSENPEEVGYQEAVMHVRRRMIPVSPVTYEAIADRPHDILYSLLPGRGGLVVTEGVVHFVSNDEVRVIDSVSDIGYSGTGALAEAAKKELKMLQDFTRKTQ